jgi:fatty-acyl-CoA synthase
VLQGLMMDDFPLTIQHILERMRGRNARAEVVTLLNADGDLRRATYGECAERVDRLAAGLRSLGVQPGDRVATFMWNCQEHLEAYLAIPTMGAVLHTLNVRLFDEQLEYIVNHAEDSVILVHDSLVPKLAPLADRFEGVRHFVLVGDGDAGALPNVVRYDDLLSAQDGGFDYPELDERMAAGLCYTSGTTGNPKGVLYSHRSTMLHTLSTCMGDALDVRGSDRVLPVVPMFHANAWGLPYGATLAGASLIMPAGFLAPEPLARLIEGERVTIAGAVPTIWMDLLRYADEHKPDLSSLRLVACGGAAVPRSLMQAFGERHDVPIVQAWGMTETSPLGAVAHPPAGVEGEDEWAYRTASGRVSAFVEARLVADDETLVPWDDESTGELEVRGPWIAARYFNDPTGDDKFRDGWLRTGDIASIDADGYIRITDRAKDVIKSGGEWVSSVELENELMAHPDVVEAAVIAMPHERWTERPLACVVLREGAATEPGELREHLLPRVAKWWIPDAFSFIDAVPKTSVGKFDKKVLRRQLADGELSVVDVEAART